MNEVAIIVRLCAACCAVGAVLAAFRYVAIAIQRRGLRGAPDARRLAILETAYLPAGASLHVVRAGDRAFVVGRSASHIAYVCEVDAGAPSRGDAEQAVAAKNARSDACPPHR